MNNENNLEEQDLKFLEITNNLVRIKDVSTPKSIFFYDEGGSLIYEESYDSKRYGFFVSYEKFWKLFENDFSSDEQLSFYLYDRFLKYYNCLGFTPLNVIPIK